MRGVFQFWGYGRDAWERLTGDEGTIIPATAGETHRTTFGRLRFTGPARDLLADFADAIDPGPHAFIRFPEPSVAAGSDTAVVRLETDGGEMLPLLSLVDGRWRFYFDVDETIEYVQQERYFETRPPIYVRLGVAPESLPAAARKAAMMAFGVSRALIRKVKYPAPFPRPYKDFSVDVWRFLVRAIVDQSPGDVPAGVALWPDGKDYAVVLNHDVDTTWGLDNADGIAAFRAIEESLGLRSAWMVVAELDQAGASSFRDLAQAGHEIGCHGVRHDHDTAYLPPARIRARLEEARPFLDAYDCVGFRAPSYHRSEALYAALDSVLDYDMSMHDCFENANSQAPSFEGCATCFPFRLTDTRVLQIPTTVAEDFVLEMAGQDALQARQTQGAIVADIRRRRGVANILTHPEPQLSARRPWIDCYRGLLEDLATDQSAWFALPRDVCRWWNQRMTEIDATWR